MMYNIEFPVVHLQRCLEAQMKKDLEQLKIKLLLDMVNIVAQILLNIASFGMVFH